MTWLLVAAAYGILGHVVLSGRRINWLARLMWTVVWLPMVLWYVPQSFRTEYRRRHS